MSPITHLSIIFLVFTIFAHFSLPVHAYTVNGNMIRDLEKNDTNFAAEASHWFLQANGTVPATITTRCEGTYLMGGAGILTIDGSFKRKYEDLPPHDMIYFSVYVTFIDQWYMNASFILHFDDRSAGLGIFLFDYTDDFKRDYCGDSTKPDLPGLVMSGKVKHSEPTVTLNAWTLNHYDPTIRAFGFRDIVLHFRNKTKEDFVYTCGNSDETQTGIFTGQCDCPEGQYKPYGGGPCQTCNSHCETCLGALPSQCLKCKPQAFFNGTECKACHASCGTCFGADEDQCLTCPLGYFLFEGNRCVDSCGGHLIPGTNVDGQNTCTFPCDDDKFLSSVGNCQGTCDFTYNSVLWHGRNFCNDYCSSGLLFVPPTTTVGGSCLVSCPLGTTQDAVAPYCHRCQDTLCAYCPINNGAVCTSCQSGGVLDSNGVCKKCDFMTIFYSNPRETGHQYKMQLFPASCNLEPTAVQNHLNLTSGSRALLPSGSFEVAQTGPNKYIVNLNFQDSLLSDLQLNVVLSSLTGSINVPRKLIPSEELQAVAEAAPAIEAVVTSVVATSFAAGAALGSTAAVWSIMSFQQFVGYFKYINVEFPFQLEIFFSILGGGDLWGFLPNPLETLTENMKQDMLGDKDGDEDDYSPPEKFALDEMPSFFIENGGGIIMTNLMMHLLLISIEMLQRIRKSEHRFLKALRVNLRWNVLVRAFLENGIPLFVAICLNLRILSLDNAYVGIGSFATFIALIYCIIMFVFCIKYLNSNSIKQLKEDDSKALLGTLTEGVELKGIYSKYYHMLIFMRGLVLVLLVVFFEDIPFFQIIPLLLMNAALIYYLFQEMSFEDRYLTYVNRTKETLILIGEVFILGLNFKNATETHYNTMGWLGVICFTTSLLIELVYMIALQIKNFKEIKKKIIAVWNAVRNWFKNMKARERNEIRKTKRKYSRALQQEASIEIGHHMIGQMDTQFNE